MKNGSSRNTQSRNSSSKGKQGKMLSFVCPRLRNFQIVCSWWNHSYSHLHVLQAVVQSPMGANLSSTQWVHGFFCMFQCLNERRISCKILLTVLLSNYPFWWEHHRQSLFNFLRFRRFFLTKSDILWTTWLNLSIVSKSCRCKWFHSCIALGRIIALCCSYRFLRDVHKARESSSYMYSIFISGWIWFLITFKVE